MAALALFWSLWVSSLRSGLGVVGLPATKSAHRETTNAGKNLPVPHGPARHLLIFALKRDHPDPADVVNVAGIGGFGDRFRFASVSGRFAWRFGEFTVTEPLLVSPQVE